MVRRDDARTVYSSEHGRLCPRCGAPSGRCRCQPRASASVPAEGDGIVRVSRTRRGRRGKIVTEISGLPLAEPDLRDLASDLKRLCATGGSVKDGIIEIQGDQRDTLVLALEERGFRPKRSGG